MTRVTVTVRGLDELLARLGNDRMVRRELRRAMDKSVKELWSRTARYPTRQSSGPVRFVSGRQRRWFFWALRTGRITIPYRRTVTLGRSISGRVRDVFGGILGLVGTLLKYAPYVIGPDKQAAIHRGNWHTIAQVAEEKAGEVQRFFEEAARNVVRRWAGR